MGQNRMRASRITTVFMIAALAVAAQWCLLTGCDRIAVQHAAVSSSPSPVEEAPVEKAPSSGVVDKERLAADLGWGQVSRGNESRQQVALTFDAGSGGESTPAILDALEAAGVRCTFFLTGQFVESYPELVKRMADAGHELANHSYSHPRFTTITPAEAASQITRTEAAVKKLTGLSTRPYFRFPYGAGSNALVEQINSLGYIGVLWTFDSLDSLDGTTAAQIRERVRQKACPGAIVLMHCGSRAEAGALPGVLSDLEAAGYQVVTLTEVLIP